MKYLLLGLSPLARGTRERGEIPAGRARFIPAGAGNSFSSSSIAVVLTVYPRWRGELLIRSSYSAPLAGLSPLARGTHILIGIHELRPRFIPAGAGNSATRWQSSYPTTVYPRWRGELAVPLHQRVQNPGLSPLARGTRHMPDHMCSNGRFIPAGAGNFATGFMQAAQKSVYPRWRGELQFIY